MTKRRRGRPKKRASRKKIVRASSRRTNSRNDNLFSSISPETKKGIFVFILLIIGFLSFLETAPHWRDVDVVSLEAFYRTF